MPQQVIRKKVVQKKRRRRLIQELESKRLVPTPQLYMLCTLFYYWDFPLYGYMHKSDVKLYAISRNASWPLDTMPDLGMGHNWALHRFP